MTKKSRFSKKGFWIITSVVALAGLIFFMIRPLFASSDSTLAPTFRIATVQRETITANVIASGSLAPANQIVLSFNNSAL